MKRLILLVLFVAAAWYGWRHWRSLRDAPGDEAVVENVSGRVMERVRLQVGNQDLPARDSIVIGGSAALPFHASRDTDFHLRWLFRGQDADLEWTGGEVTAGPVRSRHHLLVQPDGGVVATSEPIRAARR